MLAPMDSKPLDRDVFGPLVDISEQSLVTLATKVVQQSLNSPDTGGKVTATLGGSYNIVYIIELKCTTKVTIRVPATR